MVQLNSKVKLYEGVKNCRFVTVFLCFKPLDQFFQLQIDELKKFRFCTDTQIRCHKFPIAVKRKNRRWSGRLLRLLPSLQFNDFQRNIFLFCQKTQQPIDVIIRIGATIGIISDQSLFIRAFSGFNAFIERGEGTIVMKTHCQQ